MSYKKALLILSFLSALYSTLTKADDIKWMFIPKSDSVDFKIICSEGKETIWSINQRDGISDDQVARYIYVGHMSDGRTILRFMRGYSRADKETTYIPAISVNCEISEN